MPEAGYTATKLCKYIRYNLCEHDFVDFANTQVY